MNKLTNFLLKVGSGYEVIEDYGLIYKADNAFGMGQYIEVNLLKCKLKNGNEAFVLKETCKGKFILGSDSQFYVISKEALLNLRQIISNKILPGT